MTINNNFLLMNKSLIRKLFAPESLMDHVSPKTTQVNTPVTRINYTIELGYVIWCLLNK